MPRPLVPVVLSLVALLVALPAQAETQTQEFTSAMAYEQVREASLETLPSLPSEKEMSEAARERALRRAMPHVAAPRNPWLAGGLTLALPWAAAAPALVGLVLPVLASPLALTSGYLYGGDPSRGVWVGLGGYGAMLAGAGVGLGFNALAGGPLAPLGGALTGGGVGLGAYSLWAAADAYQTTDRLSRNHSLAVLGGR